MEIYQPREAYLNGSMNPSKTFHHIVDNAVFGYSVGYSDGAALLGPCLACKARGEPGVISMKCALYLRNIFDPFPSSP